ncbi:MAG: sulfur carrier protein ThiS [Pyrinomonadaceae bacterium]|nr:sulfur carrier protein ThiS [Pyrinomonadaceae bacterium]MBP6212165.1 sulfur carrier protein ThiS [Pyrinomonadaceae bacterium]
MAPINITLNGETREVPAEVDLDHLLELFSLPKQRVAIELNHAVVRRTDWPTTEVRDGDKLEVVHFVGGG